MAASAIQLLTDPRLRADVAETAFTRVREQFCVDLVVPMYERYYARMLK